MTQFDISKDENQADIFTAVKKNNIGLLTTLLSNGADANQTNPFGETPLHIATQNGFIDSVNLLLKNHGDPNKVDQNGLAPLHIAARKGHDEIIRTLLNNHANPNLWSKNGGAALHLAIAKAKHNSINILKKCTDANIKLPSIIYSQQWLIERIKALGYNVAGDGLCFGIANMGMQAILANQTKKFDARLLQLFLTPLEIFVREKHKKMSTNLPEESLAFFDGVILYQSSYLYPEYFAINKQPSCQNTLETSFLTLPNKLEKLSKNGENRKICRISCFSNVYTLDDLKEFFISLGKQLASIKAPCVLMSSNGSHAITVGYNAKKKYPWMYINAGITQYISNANILARNIYQRLKHGNKKILFATKIYITENNRNTILPKITEWQESPKWQLMHSVTAEKIIFFDTHNNHSWFSLACKVGDTERVAALLKHGVKFDGKNKRGNTVLHVAVNSGHIEVVKILLQHQIDIHCRNDNLKTPLHLAAKYGHAEILELLLNQHANPNHKDHLDYSSLHYVAFNLHDELVKRILTTKISHKNIKSVLQLLPNNCNEAQKQTVAYERIHKLLTLRIALEKIAPTKHDLSLQQLFAKSVAPLYALKQFLYNNSNHATLNVLVKELKSKKLEKIYNLCCELYPEKFNDHSIVSLKERATVS